MVKGATITMDYNEFRKMEDELVEWKKSSEKYSKMADEAIADIESDKYVIALNDIESILIRAVERGNKTIAAKQQIIDDALDVYCKVFDIPGREELA